ncbi:Azf1p KNAG_0H03480 [Huiozyma naganishii CBS 8797]|uniref:C2H2-type domain-containing protein n=1 Tax=Huiozyma naganishii (strain ATCC MYA-139 / BCRC 22969 / CBS 8797 / KCTC 17520 / NBRC 10181 / NCYC 3082 / Yp74L-3) TaxID=1071383 RepID=J7S207_HUIN7|nr:hypothetical protein KNAG_0H03480 [Kazachstania naganishii CBS 8797]CCK71762.1 hypothetical protein KNAG_0H03480 [Kazachstania naganishii CBS 8797]
MDSGHDSMDHSAAGGEPSGSRDSNENGGGGDGGGGGGQQNHTLSSSQQPRQDSMSFYSNYYIQPRLSTDGAINNFLTFPPSTDNQTTSTSRTATNNPAASFGNRYSVSQTGLPAPAPEFSQFGRGFSIINSFPQQPQQQPAQQQVKLAANQEVPVFKVKYAKNAHQFPSISFPQQDNKRTSLSQEQPDMDLFAGANGGRRDSAFLNYRNSTASQNHPGDSRQNSVFDSIFLPAKGTAQDDATGQGRRRNSVRDPHLEETKKQLQPVPPYSVPQVHSQLFGNEYAQGISAVGEAVQEQPFKKQKPAQKKNSVGKKPRGRRKKTTANRTGDPNLKKEQSSTTMTAAAAAAAVEGGPDDAALLGSTTVDQLMLVIQARQKGVTEQIKTKPNGELILEENPNIIPDKSQLVGGVEKPQNDNHSHSLLPVSLANSGTTDGGLSPISLDNESMASPMSSQSPNESFPAQTPQQQQKKHECPYCHHKFAQTTHLEVHVRSHLGYKPFECQFCGKRFTQGGNLRTHQRLHTGEKPYACQHCSKRFSRKGNLAAHQLTHREVKPFLCKLDNCGKTFAQLGNMKNHQNRFHSQTVLELSNKLAHWNPQTDSIPKKDRELLQYFASIYKNSNKGIKGRGKGSTKIKPSVSPQEHQDLVLMSPALQESLQQHTSSLNTNYTTIPQDLGPNETDKQENYNATRNNKGATSTNRASSRKKNNKMPINPDGNDPTNRTTAGNENVADHGEDGPSTGFEFVDDQGMMNPNVLQDPLVQNQFNFSSGPNTTATNATNGTPVGPINFKHINYKS